MKLYNKYKFILFLLITIFSLSFVISCSNTVSSTTVAIVTTKPSETTIVPSTTVAETTTTVEETTTSTTENTDKFLNEKNLEECFVGLPLADVEKLQNSEGWPPVFPFNPTLIKSFTARAIITKIFDKDGNLKDISMIIFNLPIGTEIISPIEGALTFGGGPFKGDGKGGNNIYIGLNNTLGRIQFAYFLKEPMQPVDMDKLEPKSYSEGSVLLKIDNETTTTDFGIVSTDDPGNLVMVMREASKELESPIISMDFNSFLKDEDGKIVYISK